MGRLPSALAMPLCVVQSICNATRPLAIQFIVFRWHTLLREGLLGHEAPHGRVAHVAVVHHLVEVDVVAEALGRLLEELAQQLPYVGLQRVEQMRRRVARAAVMRCG